MAISYGKVAVTCGLLSLFHAAYSAAQHRAYLRMTEQDFTHLPADILLQIFISLFVTCLGICKV